MCATRILVLFILLATTSACQQWDLPDNASSLNNITATTAYLVFFGSPVAESGKTAAFVGFFPHSDNVSLVSPVPLIFPDKKPSVEDLLACMMKADDEELAALGLFNPFPDGAKLIAVKFHDELLVIELSRSVARNFDQQQNRALMSLLNHTLGQFPEIKRVIVTANGIPLFREQDVRSPNPMQVVGPGTARPIVLRQYAARETSTSFSLVFDRPVCLHDVKLFDMQGNVVVSQGEESGCSITFDLYSQQGGSFPSGRKFQVMWRASDGLHQLSTGEMTLPVLKPRKVDFAYNVH